MYGVFAAVEGLLLLLCLTKGRHVCMELYLRTLDFGLDLLNRCQAAYQKKRYEPSHPAALQGIVKQQGEVKGRVVIRV